MLDGENTRKRTEREYKKNFELGKTAKPNQTKLNRRWKTNKQTNKTAATAALIIMVDE